VTADLVLLSGRLLDPGTGDILPEPALVASGGRITVIADDATCRAEADPETTVGDLHGAVVTPGLVDGHMHPVPGAERTAGIDLSRCTGLPDVHEALAAGARGADPGRWLRGWGLDPNGVQLRWSDVRQPWG